MLSLNFSPFPEIRTERLLLRRMQQEDAPQLLLLRSNDLVMQYIGREKMRSLEDAEAFIQKIHSIIEAREGIMWAIALTGDPATMIGNINFWQVQPEHYRAEVGYMLHPEYWNKGIMKEALLAVIDYGFSEMKLHSIEAQINPGNTASGRLLEKTGFTREAYFKENFFFKDRFYDSAVYSLLVK